MTSTKTKKSKTPRNHDNQIPDAVSVADNHEPEASGKPTKSGKATTRPGKKVISLIVDEKWAARVSLCARALGQSQTEYLVRIVSKSLKANLAAALDALKAEADVE